MRGASRWRLSWLCVTLALCVHASPAWADQYDAALRRAVAQKERALDHNTPDQWDSALRLFIAADRLRETAECKFELGYAAEQMQQHDVALGAYEAALRLGLGGSAASQAQAFVQAHEQAVGRLEVRGEAGAEVWIGGYLRGVLPLSGLFPVFPGNGSVQLVTPKGTTHVPFSVAAGQSVVVEPPPPEPAAPKPASPTVASPPNTEPPPAPPPPSPPSDARGVSYAPLGWGLGVSGVVVAGVGVTFAALAPGMIQQGRTDLERECAELQGMDACRLANQGRTDAAQRAVDSIATWKGVETAAWVGVGVGAAALAAGAVLLWFSYDSSDAASVAIWPAFGPDTVGIMAKARF